MPKIPIQGGLRRPTCSCAGCQKPNCGECTACRNMRCFGGDGNLKERCRHRPCLLRQNSDRSTSKRSAAAAAAAAAPPAAADEDDTEELASSYSRGRPKRSRTAAAAASIEINNNTSDEASGGASRNTAPRTASATKPKKIQNYKDNQNRRERCGTCPGCLRDDCGTCYRCLGKKKFGGDGKIGRICAQRRCHVLYPQQKRKEEREAEMAAAASRRIRADEQQGEDDEDEDDGNSSNSSSSSGSFAAAARRATSRSKRRKRTGSSRGSRSRKASFNKEDSSLRSDSTPIEDATNVFTLTKYFAKQEESANAQLEKDKRKPPPRATTLYGLPIPMESPANLCAGCLGERDDELEDQPVLLCDGQNCGREYHLQCCVPQLACVPKDTDQWLCQDCSPEGSTASLVKYLESMDQARADFLQNLSADVVDPESEFIRFLLRQDSQEIGLPDDCRFPESEMERSAMTHSLALCDSKALTRTRGGSESNREPLTTRHVPGQANSTLQFGGQPVPRGPHRRLPRATLAPCAAVRQSHARHGISRALCGGQR